MEIACDHNGNISVVVVSFDEKYDAGGILL